MRGAPSRPAKAAAAVTRRGAQLAGRVPPAAQEPGVLVAVVAQRAAAVALASVPPVV